MPQNAEMNRESLDGASRDGAKSCNAYGRTVLSMFAEAASYVGDAANANDLQASTTTTIYTHDPSTGNLDHGTDSDR